MSLEQQIAHNASNKYLAVVDFCLTLRRFEILEDIGTILIGAHAYNILCPY